MKIIELPQGSDLWLDFRRKHITATDASVIMQTNGFKDPMTLWEEKNGFREPEPMNDKMRRGQELESEARQRLSDAIGIAFTPYVVVHDVEEWCMASLDGISECKKVLCELKAPNEKTHEMCIAGNIPDYYYTQIQHQLFTTGAEKCVYCTYRPEYAKQQLAFYEIKPHAAYIQQMIRIEKLWYTENLIGGKAPGWRFKCKSP